MINRWAKYLRGVFLSLGLLTTGILHANSDLFLLDTHAWPFFTNWNSDSETIYQKKIAGPLLELSSDSNERRFALRPLYSKREYIQDKNTNYSSSFLYPLFNYRNYTGHEEWRFLNLIRYSKITVDTEEKFESDIVKHYKKSFEIFPFYFNHDAYKTENRYAGFLPLWGEVKGRIFYKRIFWAGFPLYSEWERKDEKTYAFLWPIFRYRTGPTSKGFNIWPLYGNFERENDYHQRFALWPLIYYHQNKLYSEDPITELGILPLYTRKTHNGYIREDYLWPFFGYTHDENKAYKEARIFYPIIAQGRGKDRYLNQTAPLYSLSHRNGKKSNWFLWPLFNNKSYNMNDVHVNKFKFLYFIYQDTTQTTNDESKEFLGTKKHLWPLYSYWKGKESQKQFQFLSPLEPLFPNNSTIRFNYSPLFTIFRYNKKDDQNTDIDLLFSLIQYEHRPTHNRLEIGPLFGYQGGDDIKNFQILKGLFEYQKSDDKRKLRLLWMNIDLGANNQETQKQTENE